MSLPLRESTLAPSNGFARNDSILLGRAELLDQADHDLVEAVLIAGQPATLVGRMVGLSPEQVRCRVRRLTKRLVSKQFVEAARALRYLSPPDAELARLRYCAFMDLETLARRLDIKPHALRRRLARIRAQIDVICRKGRQGIRLGPMNN